MGAAASLVAIGTPTASLHGEVKGAPCHDKQLPDHAGALADILLHQLAARDPDEGAVCVVSDGPRQQSLARPWWPIQQDALHIAHCGSQAEFQASRAQGCCHARTPWLPYPQDWARDSYSMGRGDAVAQQTLLQELC